MILSKQYIDDTIEGAVETTLVNRTLPKGPQFLALTAYIVFIVYLFLHKDFNGLVSAAGYTTLLVSVLRKEQATAILGYLLLLLGLPYSNWWEGFAVIGYLVSAYGHPETGRAPAAIYHAVATTVSTSPVDVLFRIFVVLYLA
jgi:hypothetical protein